VPMNVVERQPLEALIPECRARGVGVTIMKPLATGLLPAPLALKWLANQPIHTAVPGTTTLEELEENAAVGALERFALTGDEAREVMALHESLEHVRCRVCSACQPACPQGIRIGTILGTDVMYDHYRTMGAEAFAAYAWSREALARDLPERGSDDRRHRLVHALRRL
jgi:predicted aldo/keto reductase-like oxidoreductase